MTGLYLHIPFCEKKCFYCSFNVVINQQHHQDEYVRCLLKEMEFYKGRDIDTVYFGGGSPSQLSEKNFLLLIDSIRRNFRIANEAEITIEVNPEDVSRLSLKCYHRTGVNRLSIGVQSFNDKRLSFLGRCHDSSQAREAIDLAGQTGFNTVNIDLMYGFPEQSLEEIDDDLKSLSGLSCGHVSLYTLTVEKGSRFFVDKIVLPDQEKMAEQYLFVRKRLQEMGFEHYEVSNFAKPASKSCHNLNYWQGGNYIGLGVGAHSHEDGRRWWNANRLRQYIEKTVRGERPEEGDEMLAQRQRLGEALVFGLRVLDGVELDEIQKRHEQISPSQKKGIEELIEQELLEYKKGFLKVTDRGLLVLDEISQKLL